MKFLSKLTLFVSALGLSCGAFGMDAPEYSSGFKYEFGLNDAFSIGSAASAWQAVTEKTVPTVVEKTVSVVTEVVAETAPIVVEEAGKLTQLWNTVGNTFSNSLQWLGETRPLEWLGETSTGQWICENPKRGALYLGGSLITLGLIYKIFFRSADKKKLLNTQAKKPLVANNVSNDNNKNIAGDASKVAKILNRGKTSKETLAGLYKVDQEKPGFFEKKLSKWFVSKADYEAWLKTQKK